MGKNKTEHSGRFMQTSIYLGKFFRMFVYQNDWKVLPMAAIIAGLVCFVIGANLFKTQEGTLLGSFAMSCICIWNGFFNSIQVICRERAIVKREHRAGLHMSAYIGAHMIYQAFLCLCQTVITLGVCYVSKVSFPAESLVTGYPIADIGISIFLITYCADMLALMVSAFARTTTTAMTVMPFLLIFQLIFSGGFFSLSGPALKLTDLTVAKWGLTSLCIQGDYNSLPAVSLWNSLVKLQNVEVMGETPVRDALIYMQDHDMQTVIQNWTGQNNQNPVYAFDMDGLFRCWGFLLLWIFVYVAVAVIALEFIDRDKR